jgi:hypothetical protein
MLAFPLTWFLCFYSFFRCQYRGRRILVCMTCFLDYLAGAWYGVVIYLVWLIGCYLSCLVRLMGVAVVHICDLYIITLRLQLFSYSENECSLLLS